jgi:cell division protein ZapA
VRIEIYDQSYNLKGALDEEYVADLARYVDGKMRAVGQSARTADTLRVAVLAALNIADELHALQKRHTEMQTQLRGRAERCLAAVEQTLADTA